MSDTIIDLNGGVAHVVALDGDGVVWDWGDNNRGQLGTGDYRSTHVPQRVPLPEPVSQVAAGQHYSLALSADGQHVYSWGDNREGELGIGTSSVLRTATPQQVDIPLQPGQSITSICGGGRAAYALTSTGQVYGWGANELAQAGQDPAVSGKDIYKPMPIGGLSNVTALSAGDHQLLALKPDGTVWALGANQFGQLGPNGPTPSPESSTFKPVQVTGLPPIKSLATGGESSFAVDRQGSVWAWGRNTYGQLGLGYKSQDDGPHATPTQIAGLSNVVSINAEGPSTVAADASGNVYAWGFNHNGEVGNGTRVDATAPQHILSAGALGPPVRVGSGHWFHYAYNPQSGNAYAWGRNDLGQLRLPGGTRNNLLPIGLDHLLPTTGPVTCFVAGTLIRTPNGERPIEDLAAGDLVLTASGIHPIRWIGRRRLDPRRHAQPDFAQPVRIAADAFGEGQPVRDLYLSPRHCVAQAGALIPIELLVDGVSIERMNWSSVEYFRLELEAHDLLWAEGLPAESYMYGGLRADDDETGDPLARHPACAYAPEEDTCLPLVVAGPVVDSVKAALASRARAVQLARLGAGLGRVASRVMRIACGMKPVDQRHAHLVGREARPFARVGGHDLAPIGRRIEAR